MQANQTVDESLNKRKTDSNTETDLDLSACKQNMLESSPRKSTDSRIIETTPNILITAAGISHPTHASRALAHTKIGDTSLGTPFQTSADDNITHRKGEGQVIAPAVFSAVFWVYFL